jgi:hypothetical protein
VVDEGRKRVIAIVAGILVARHLKSAEELHEWRSTPKTESLVASAVNWAERIMRKIDSTFGKPDTKLVLVENKEEEESDTAFAA